MGRSGYPRLVSGNIAPQLPQNSSQLGRPCCLFSKQHWDFPESATFHQATLLVVFTDTAWYLASVTPVFTRSSVAADRTSSPTPIGLVFLDWKKWICTCGVGNQMLRCSVLQQVPCLIRGCAEPVKRTVLHNSTVAHEILWNSTEHHRDTDHWPRRVSAEGNTCHAHINLHYPRAQRQTRNTRLPHSSTDNFLNGAKKSVPLGECPCCSVRWRTWGYFECESNHGQIHLEAGDRASPQMV